jgi:hypothetical protein
MDLKPNGDTKALIGFVQNESMEGAFVFNGLLCRWEHQEQFPPTFVQYIAKLLVKEKTRVRMTDLESADLQYFKEKEQQWYTVLTRKLSFKSAYRMVRNGESRMLMYINNSFAVVFENEEGSLKAFMTQSTFGIRTLLRQQGICFSIRN